MGLKIYRAEDFDTLVWDLEQAYGKEELVSLKLDCHREPNTGKILFWYAVVITKEVQAVTQPTQPFPNPYTPNLPPVPPGHWYGPYCGDDSNFTNPFTMDGNYTGNSVDCGVGEIETFIEKDIQC